MSKTQNPKLTEKDSPVALVTGASRGIGRAVAVALVKAGYRVAIVGRSQDALEATRLACSAHRPDVKSYVQDLTDLNNIPTLVERIERDFGRLDVLINNAGVGGGGKIQDAALSRWDACISTNLTAVMHLSYHAAGLIKMREGGALITIGSIASRATYGGGAAYVASKHAALGFMGCIFEDLRELGVKVSTICPGFVDTEMVTSDNLDRTKMIIPEDIADAVLYIIKSSPRVCPTEITLRPQKTPYV